MFIIFGYVVFFDKLKMFLAPQMQIYIKLSIVPMLLIGLVMIFNNKVHYRFKISDLILLLPLVLLISSGDGRLTASLAANRTTNYKTEQKVKVKSEIQEENENTEKEKKDDNKQETIEEKEQEELVTYDFSKPDFDIEDATYSELANYLSYGPYKSKYEGSTIKVRGFVAKYASYIPDGYFTLGKYEISCCAADAGFTGFFVKYNPDKVKHNNWYEIEGVLKKGEDKEGYEILYIEVVNINEIDSKSEEQYVYPCYAYDDGLCEAISKYDLEY